ncbi:chaplin [Streptomyces mirabilis]|uniref:chaplin n=1 Tax=Streptomyces mirabilis TaxID=68239 RepID=UPI001BAF0DFF|nr:chaplin [Streptomyces mirabilis]QUW85088.1 chaplin [Streptomyces mirabilis]
MVVAAATTSILSLYGTPVFADSNADASAMDSPGVVSGNSVQVPVHVPVNACGNTVNVIGALNPTFGNSCTNGSGSQGGSSGSSGSLASGRTQGSPGVLSGNQAQAPVDVPVNACGNTVDVVALLNPAFGNRCGNEPGGNVNTPPATPPTVPPVTPPSTTPPTVPPVTPVTPSRTLRQPILPVSPSGNPPTLAHTGSENVLGASAAGAALLIGGAVLYRRGRVASRR